MFFHNELLIENLALFQVHKERICRFFANAWPSMSNFIIVSVLFFMFCVQFLPCNEGYNHLYFFNYEKAFVDNCCGFV